MKAMRNRKNTLIFGLGVLGLILAYILFRGVTHSLFNSSLTRINIGIWGKHSYVVSLGKTTKQNYIFLFPNSYEVQVPGGLKGYKIGALGKLADLEKDPQLFAKAMGQGSGVFIHKYIHEQKSEIYDDDEWIDSIKFVEIKREIERSLFQQGDLSLFDRLYVYSAIRDARPSQTTLVRVKESKPELLLYDKVFRNEKKLVQMMYTDSERTAYFIAQMLENSGIRVADIAKSTTLLPNCTIIDSGKIFSQTSKFISSYFACDLEKGDTGLYEIQWILDHGVEKRWKL